MRARAFADRIRPPRREISLNPSVAGAMMAFSSVAVVTNSLLLRARWSSPEGEHQQWREGAAGYAGAGGRSHGGQGRAGGSQEQQRGNSSSSAATTEAAAAATANAGVAGGSRV